MNRRERIVTIACLLLASLGVFAISPAGAQGLGKLEGAVIDVLAREFGAQISASPSDNQVLTYDAASDTWGAEASVGATALDGLSDVTISGAARGDVIVRDATDYKNVAVGADDTVLASDGTDTAFEGIASLTESGVSAADLSDVTVTAHNDGDLLQSSSGAWVDVTVPAAITASLGNGTDGQVITSDGAGGVAWEAAAGGGDHTLADSGTSTSAEVVAVQHTTDGTAAAGFGGHIAFDLEDAGGNLEADAATIGASWVDATDTEEDAEILLSVMVAGSLTEVAQVTGSGLETIAGSETAPSVAFDNTGGGGGVTGLFNWGDEVGVVVDGDVIASFWKEGASNLNFSGQGTNKLRRWRQQVDVSTGTAASPDTQNNNDTLATVTNEGVSAICHVDLPTAVTGHTQTFVVQDADGLRVNANTGDTIRIGADVTAGAGYVESTTIGSYLTLTAINATEWVATSYYGPWTDGSWVSYFRKDWTSTTMTGSWSTNTAYECFILRDGGSAYLQVEVSISGGAPDAGNLTLTVPDSLNIDFGRLASRSTASGDDVAIQTTGFAQETGTSFQAPIICTVDEDDSTTTVYLYYVNPATGALGGVSDTNPFTFGDTDVVTLQIGPLPIEEWGD